MFRKLRRWRLISYSMSGWEKKREDEKDRERGKDLRESDRKREVM